MAGFALTAVGAGLFTLLGPSSPPALWIPFQVLAGLGAGMVLNTLLPAFQAALSERDQAAATASWAFVRSFGNIWGVAIPAAVFNNRAENLAQSLGSPEVSIALSGGHAYEHATAAFVNGFQDVELRRGVIGIYEEALRLVWQVAIGFCVAAFLLVFLEKEIPLRTELETEFGLVEEKSQVDRSKKEDTEGGTT